MTGKYQPLALHFARPTRALKGSPSVEQWTTEPHVMEAMRSRAKSLGRGIDFIPRRSFLRTSEEIVSVIIWGSVPGHSVTTIG